MMREHERSLREGEYIGTSIPPCTPAQHSVHNISVVRCQYGKR